MELKLQSLSDAISRLEEILKRYNSDPEDDALRDASVKRFEYTYALALVFLTRYLEEEAPISKTAGSMDFAELIRQAWALGLLREEVAVWRDFRLKRNLTSHTYDQSNADEVCAVIPRFLAEARFLYSQLKKRSDAS
ncbi:hypothetical protein AXK11_08130 [Cephaloticoccus primus]|uniref:Nucleotidyltransferase n=1 Tax=Cephaloticoccus primus TaxID=1548207 RepID=A0A139SJF0_9BACT|nr:HI0074 family nucleotidyltransferase substrate-binding subunit [Cephaloticoccus primus]KXU34620.1 hypothetical protein AXK11_08130 [Cephaloticoccus primus]